MLLRKTPALIVFFALLVTASTALATAAAPWHDAREVEKRLKGFSKVKRAELTSLGTSAGGTKLQMLTIDPQQNHEGPAVLVLGNPSGHSPLGTEAALQLISQLLLSDDASLADVRWHILPLANPDGAASFHAKTKSKGGLNGTPVDEDRDAEEGEDAPEDLNGDGLITHMLVPDPQGQWILSEDAFAQAIEANAALGQRGLYRREIEGRDNDGDGLFNEDGPGGVNPGRNFPHRFEHWTNEGGRWAADQPETRAILEFAFSHPEIGMILVLDRSNTLREVPEASENGANGLFTVPEKRAEMLGAKAGQSLPLEDLKRRWIEATGSEALSDGRMISLLEEDPASGVDPADHPWWTEIARQYRKTLDEAGLMDQRLDSPKPAAGSVEEWGYYQFGVPTFALDFWSLPLAAETDTTLAEAVESEEDEPEEPDNPLSEKQQALLRYAIETQTQPQLQDWRGLQPWKKVTLDDGQTVWVGGRAPFATTTPPAALVDSLLATPIKILTQLPAWLPRLELGEVNLENRGSDVYELTVWLHNQGPLPYPIAQGKRTRRPAPVLIQVEGAEILEGHGRTALEELPAHGSAKARWLIRLKPGGELTVKASAPSLGEVSRSIKAAGGGK